MRRAAKVDANQAEIVKRLRECCIQVEVIGWPMDLLIAHPNGRTELMEVKTEGGRFTKGQLDFISRWPGKVHVVRSAEEAVRAVLGEAMK